MQVLKPLSGMRNTSDAAKQALVSSPCYVPVILEDKSMSSTAEELEDHLVYTEALYCVGRGILEHIYT